MSFVGIFIGSVRRSAKEPNPDPRIIANRGLSLVRLFIYDIDCFNLFFMMGRKVPKKYDGIVGY